MKIKTIIHTIMNPFAFDVEMLGFDFAATFKLFRL